MAAAGSAAGRAWAGGAVGGHATCVLAPEPGTADPRRHQHLGARRPGRAVGRRRPRARGRRAPRPGARGGHRGRPTAGDGAAHPRPRRPRGGRARPRRAGRRARTGPGPGAAGSATRGWPAATSSRWTAWRCAWSRRPATPATRCPSCCRRTGRCSPATPSSAAAPRWSPTPTAGSATTSTRCAGCRLSRPRSGCGVLLPGHGPVLGDLPGVLAAYLAHREERLEQVGGRGGGGAHLGGVRGGLGLRRGGPRALAGGRPQRRRPAGLPAGSASDGLSGRGAAAGRRP